LLGNWDAFEADLRGPKDVPEGTLRVVVPHALGQQRLVGPLIDYLRRHERVTVEWLLHDGTPDFIAQGIDCAVHVGAVEDPSLVAVKIAEVRRIVVAAPSLLQGKPLPLHPAELQALPWLALQTFYRSEVALIHHGSKGGDRGEEHRFPIQPRLGTDSLFALRNATLLGLGASIASTWLVADDVADGRLLHLAPEWCASPLPVYLVYPYSNFYPAKLRRFVEALREGCPRAWACRCRSACIAINSGAGCLYPAWARGLFDALFELKRATGLFRPCRAGAGRSAASAGPGPGPAGHLSPAWPGRAPPTRPGTRRRGGARAAARRRPPVCRARRPAARTGPARFPLCARCRRPALGSFFQVVRGAKGRAEQPALGLRKTQVAGAHRAHVGAGEFGRRQIGRYGGQLGLHGARHGRQRGGANRIQQSLAAVEMPVGRIGRHARAPGGFAQHHGLGPAGAGQLHTGFQQGAPQVPVAVSTAGWRGLGALDMACYVFMWTVFIIFVILLWTVYTILLIGSPRKPSKPLFGPV
jgi:DNA-binding transcriptional LysR family regulator